MTSPVALDLDGQPGVDGFSLRLFANESANPKTVPITSGQIEILMFDGTLFGRTNVPPTLRTWTFTTAELKTRAFNSSIGAGYEFLLAWGTNKPTRRLITLAARHTDPRGNIITSRPSSVTVIDR